MRKRIIFDMDGTIADLYGVEHWLEKLQAQSPFPYLEAKPLCNMKELSSIITKLRNRGHEVIIVSWLSKDSTEYYKTLTRRAKREWLKQYNFFCDEVHLVQYGTSKAKFRDKTCYNILIDDDKKVRENFRKIGGKTCTTINPTKTDVIQYLTSIYREN